MEDFEGSLIIPVRIIHLSSKVKCEKELVALIYIPAFPVAVRYNISVRLKAT